MNACVSAGGELPEQASCFAACLLDMPDDTAAVKAGKALYRDMAECFCSLCYQRCPFEPFACYEPPDLPDGGVGGAGGSGGAGGAGGGG